MLVDTQFASAPLLARMARFLTAPASEGSPYADKTALQESVQNLSGFPFARLLSQIEHVPDILLSRPTKVRESNVPTYRLRDEMSGLFMGLAERCADPGATASPLVVANACGAAALLSTPQNWREAWAVETCLWTLHDAAFRLEAPDETVQAAQTLAAHTPDRHSLAAPLAAFLRQLKR